MSTLISVFSSLIYLVLMSSPIVVIIVLESLPPVENMAMRNRSLALTSPRNCLGEWNDRLCYPFLIIGWVSLYIRIWLLTFRWYALWAELKLLLMPLILPLLLELRPASFISLATSSMSTLVFSQNTGASSMSIMTVFTCNSMLISLSISAT